MQAPISIPSARHQVEHGTWHVMGGAGLRKTCDVVRNDVKALKACTGRGEIEVVVYAVLGLGCVVVELDVWGTAGREHQAATHPGDMKQRKGL